MKKKWMVLLVISVFLATVAGTITKFLRKDNRPRVVVVLQDKNLQYWNIVRAGAEKGFQEFDIKGKVVIPSSKSKKDALVYTLENILNEHPDVLVVAPNGSPAVTTILKKFVKNKIPVLLIDADIPLEHKTAYIGTNNFDLGKKAGELLASQLQPGDEVAIPFLVEDLTHPILSERMKGATLSLEAAGIKVVTEQDQSSSIKQLMTTILQKHPNVKGVYTTTDLRALEALAVIEEHGLKMPVIGADGINEMLELIKDGVLTDAVAQNPYDIGYISVETALKVIKGEQVKRNTDTGVDIISKDNAKLKLDFMRELLK
ncbi:sugar ABC transporter substrate-binding protein [Ectobacillus funiculus]|uniref:sugar ABC transporter substrate-binding protein n=1 Tax=Ectobacillus funiculus TaxID=137993 RepID=UPI00196BACC0|nr:sugar ABC transporter substrate-binding protein [Ectobacillus funiculus]